MVHSYALGKWLLLIPLLSYCIVVFGDTTQGSGPQRPPPTLQEVVESAYSRHPQLQAFDAQKEEANALESRAGSLIADNPSLAASYKTDQIGSGEGYREWEAGIVMPLWKPGQRDAARQTALSASQALSHSRRALRLAIAGEVRERMWEAALMQNNLELAKKEWDTSATLEHGIERRVELGELAKTDLLLARDATLTKRAAYAHAQMEFEKARLSYASFTSIQRLPRRRGERRSALNTITDDHPQLAELVAQLNQAKAGLIAVRRTGGGNLELFLGANGERDASNEDFNNRLGLGLSLPIGLNSHNKPAIAAATRTLAEGKTDFEKLLRRLNLELLQATEELEFAQAELELARERNQLNLESLRMARVAFESGETDLVGLLLVQKLAFSAERHETELRIIRQRAIARYNQAVGETP